MILGQAAGVAASLACERGKAAQDVNAADLRAKLTEQKAILRFKN